MTNRLPEKLSALRKHFSYSQGDVAEKLQVPVTEYMNWENGNTICRIDQLKMLAKLFKTPIEDLADNTRTVTLPRLDEDDDSVQIAFGMNSPIDREVLNNSVEETEDVTGTLMVPLNDGLADLDQLTEQIETAETQTITAPYVKEPYVEEPQEEIEEEKTRIMDTRQLMETQVTRIVDDEPEPAPAPKKTAKRPQAAPQMEPQNPKQSSSGLPFGLDRSTFILGGAVIAALVLVIVVFGVLRRGGSSTDVNVGSSNRLALGNTFSMYLAEEGQLVTAGQNIPSLDETDLVQVSAGPNWAMGLKNDGTVVCDGAGNACRVDDWENIVMIAAGASHSVGLQKDGTVVCNGSSGACGVSDWKDVKAVYAGNEITIGVTDTGDVLASGSFSSIEKVRALSNVRSVDIGSNQIVVTGIDGSVSCYAIGSASTSNTVSWTGMEHAVTGGSFAAGISNGRVTVASTDDEMVKTVSEWSGIQYIAARGNTLIAVNKNGTVIGAGDNTMGVYGENDAEPEPTEEAVMAEKLKQPSNVNFQVTSANLKITWDPVEHADYYTVSINTAPETTLKTEKPTASISTDKLKSGTSYVLRITACAKDEEKYKNSDALTLNYQFEANLTKLAMPSNIKLEQDDTVMKVSWNAVANADHYEVTVQDMTQDVSGTSVSIDLSSWGTQDFTVSVTAYPGTNDTRYTYSDTATATGRYTVKQTELGGTNIYVNDGGAGNWIITWEPVPNAGSYEVTVGTFSATVSTNSYTTPALAAGNYTITVKALPADPTHYIEHSTSITATYTPPATPTPEPTPTQEPSPEPTENPEQSADPGSETVPTE